MKKLFAVVVMAVAMAMPSHAQMSWGLQAGLNMSNVNTKMEGSVAAAGGEAVKSRTGFFVGPTVKFTLPIVGLGLDAAALYDQREGKAGDETVKSQSIQVPVNVRDGFGLGSLAEVFFFAGPQFGFNIGGGKDYGVGEWTLKSSNLSANVGIGATVLSKLQAKLNYNFALGKTGEFEMKNLVTGKDETVASSKFNAWQISLAYFF